MRKRDCELWHTDGGLAGVPPRGPGPGRQGMNGLQATRAAPRLTNRSPRRAKHVPPGTPHPPGPPAASGSAPHPALPGAGCSVGEPRRPRIPSPERGDQQELTRSLCTARSVRFSGSRAGPPKPGPGTRRGRHRRARISLSICAGRSAARPAEVTSRIPTTPEGRPARKRPWCVGQRLPVPLPAGSPSSFVEGAGRTELIGQRGMAPGEEFFISRGGRWEL